MSKTDPQSFIPLKTNWFHIMLTLAGGALCLAGVAVSRSRLRPKASFGAETRTTTPHPPADNRATRD